MNCRVCRTKINSSFAFAKILNRDVKYFECSNCKYIQTEYPEWLDEAYSSPINLSDTGILARNLSNVGLVLATLNLIHKKNGPVVDYAGGYGFLVRLLRDKGVDAYWSDPYCENLVARGFEYNGEDIVSLLTAFEVFEHFVKPLEEMDKMLSISPNILLTTTLAPKPTPNPNEWWYYGLQHGQHIGFFRIETLKYLADIFKLYLITDGISSHLFTCKKQSYLGWRLLRRISIHCPSLLTKGLSTKTWTDSLRS